VWFTLFYINGVINQDFGQRMVVQKFNLEMGVRVDLQRINPSVGLQTSANEASALEIKGWGKSRFWS